MAKDQHIIVENDVKNISVGGKYSCLWFMIPANGKNHPVSK